MTDKYFNNSLNNIIKENKSFNFSPINKTSTLNLPYNKKKVSNLMKSIKLNENDSLFLKKNNFRNNSNNSCTKKGNNKIDNKIINIKINYNDKHYYYDNHESEINFKNKKKQKQKHNNKYHFSNQSNILEIDLNKINTGKRRIKNSLTSGNLTIGSPTNSYGNIRQPNYNINKCSYKIKKNEQKLDSNSRKKLMVTSSNLNKKKKSIKISKDNCINKYELENEKEVVNNIVNLIKDEQIILLMKENNDIESRKNGFIKLSEFIRNESNKKIIINNINDFFMFVYMKLNHFQENNILLIILGLTCIYNIFEYVRIEKNNDVKKDLNKIYIEIIVNKIKKKINNIKIRNIYFKLLYLFSNIFSIKDILDILLNNISIKNVKSQILKEYFIYIKNVLERIKFKKKDINNLKAINIKNLLNFIIHIATNDDIEPELKSLCVRIICVLNQIYGSKIKEYLKGINEPLFQLVENELKKLIIVEKKNVYNYSNSNTNIIRNNNKGKIKESKIFMIKNKINLKHNLTNDNILLGNNINIKKEIRKNISKELNQKLMYDLSSGDLETKKNVIDYINKLLIKYNNKISINGLRPLFFIIKDNINDVEPNNVCLFLGLLSNLILALGPHIKIYEKILIFPLFLNLSNKFQQIRENSYICIEKWMKVQGFNAISFFVPNLLNNKNSNVTMKIEIMKLLLSNHNLIQFGNKEKSIGDFSKALINCLISKNLLLRNITEKLIIKLSKVINKEEYFEEINNKDCNAKEKEYLFYKINTLFFNCSQNRNTLNKIIISNDNNTHKKLNSLNRKRTKLFNEISSDSDNNNINFTNNNINFTNNNNNNTQNKSSNSKAKINSLNKQKLLEGRNLSNLQLNAFNLKTFNMSLKQSIENVDKSTNKKSVLNTDKTLNSIIDHIYFNQNPNMIKYSNDNLYDLKSSLTNSMIVKRKKTESGTFNKLLCSSILLSSKIKKRLNFDEETKSLPNDIKEDLKKLKIVHNFNNRKDKIEKKKRLSNILLKSSSKNRCFSSQVLDNKSNLLDESTKRDIFLNINSNSNEKNDKRIRYEEDKELNFDIIEILDFKNLYQLRSVSNNIFSFNFIQNLFSNDINNIILSLSKLNKLIQNCISEYDTNIAEKIFSNLDILLKLISMQLYKKDKDSLTKSFFIFVFSLIELSKLMKYKFNDTEITILLNILCNKLKSDKEILEETAYNLIFYLNNICNDKKFIITLVKLLKYQNNNIIQETINIIQNLCERSKYNKNIICEIIEDIVKLYFFNFDKQINFKNKSILPLLKKIYDVLGDKFWEYCTFLSIEKKDFLLKNLIGHNPTVQNNICDIEDDNLSKFNNNNICLSSNKMNNNAYRNYFSYKNKIGQKFMFKKKARINSISTNHIKEDKNDKTIKRNKTTENISIYQTLPEMLNGMHYSFKNQIIYRNKKEKNAQNKDNSIESQILKELKKLNIEYSDEEIIIDGIISIYSLIYKNYLTHKDIILGNIDNIIDTFIKKINNLINNIKSRNISVFNILRYLFDVLYKIFTLENLNIKISYEIHQKLFLVLISTSSNKEIKFLNEHKNENSENCEIILKSVNYITAHIVKHFDITNNILILIDIIKNNTEFAENVIHCLYLVIQNIKENENYLSLRIYRIFKEIENLLNYIGKENSIFEQSVILIIKKLIFEIIQYRKETILEIKDNVKNELIKNWINDILKSDNKDDMQKGFLFGGETFYSKINEINQDLKSREISPEERIERNFKNIQNKWNKIHNQK